jgi:3-deoxy-manno-octulosonate cytidylyltransferase (CMP-KDO synthetase)
MVFKERSPLNKIIGIIPARYKSTRFPAKMLCKIGAKTLIQRTYENALRCSSLDLVIIATDHQEIFDHVKGFGGEVVMTSVSCPTGADRLAEAVQNNLFLQEASIIVNIQGDEPCLNPETIDKMVTLLKNSDEAVMATACVKLTSPEEALSPSIVKCVFDKEFNALYFSRALIPAGHSLKMQAGKTYYRHMGVYAYRKDFLLQYPHLPSSPLQMAEDLEQLKVLENGYKIKVAVVDHFSIGVDHPEDIQKVEQWLCKQNIYS